MSIMERTLLLTAVTWVGGVGAWAVGAGYTLAQNSQQSSGRGGGAQEHEHPTRLPHGNGQTYQAHRATRVRFAPAPIVMYASDDGSDSSESSPVVSEVLDAESMPVPPMNLDATPMEEATPPSSPSAGAIGAESTDLEMLRPPDANLALLTESQRRRLAPVKSLRRTRRSRKIRRVAQDEKTFVPIVKGARPTTDEAILTAYNMEGEGEGATQAQRQRGEDYWVDPKQVQREFDKKAETERKVAARKKDENAFKEDRLKAEIVAPYKSGTIVKIVAVIGALGVAVALFPNLLELSEPGSIASFPAEL